MGLPLPSKLRNDLYLDFQASFSFMMWKLLTQLWNLNLAKQGKSTVDAFYMPETTCNEWNGYKLHFCLGIQFETL